MDKNVTSAHVDKNVTSAANLLLNAKEKQIKVLKHTTQINADILKDINTTVVQVSSENKLPYPVDNMLSPSKCRDDVIMTSLFHNFENS